MTRRSTSPREASSRRALVLVLGLLALALSGCSLVLDTDPRPENHCGGDGDCGTARCDTELGLCVTDMREPYAFALQVVLPADELEARPALTVNLPPMVAAAGRASAEIVVPLPVPVAGTVRTVEGVLVDADLVFAPRPSTLGAPLPSVTVSTIVNPGDEPRDLDYLTQLVPGVVYDVEVRPRGPAAALHPPLRTELELRTGQMFPIEIPAESILVRGIVVDAGGVGQNGLEVRAIELDTGRRVSSIATTATVEPVDGRAEDGIFELHVDPGAGRWVLRVSAPPEYQELAVFPAITVDPSVLVYEGAPGQERVRLLVPSPDTGVRFEGTVEFPEGVRGASCPPDVVNCPAVGATVTLRSSQLMDERTGLVGAFTVQMISEAGGGFGGHLLPGTYAVEIRPLETELGVFVGEQVIPADRDTLGRIFSLPARTTIGGEVRRSIDEPIADARVRAIPLHLPLPTLPAGSGLEALLNRPGDTVSGADGRFRLPLDTGIYDLIVEPPAGSGFPWLVRAEYGVGGSSAGVSEPFDVRTPVAVRGQARFDDGDPVARAEVLAFAIVGASGRERPVPIARATTAADGSFLLLLPPEL